VCLPWSFSPRIYLRSPQRLKQACMPSRRHMLSMPEKSPLRLYATCGSFWPTTIELSTACSRFPATPSSGGISCSAEARGASARFCRLGWNRLPQGRLKRLLLFLFLCLMICPRRFALTPHPRTHPPGRTRRPCTSLVLLAASLIWVFSSRTRREIWPKNEYSFRASSLASVRSSSRSSQRSNSMVWRKILVASSGLSIGSQIKLFGGKVIRNVGSPRK